MPGVRLNVSKSGVSASLGGRGATVNVGKRGVRGTVGIPGSGLSYSTKLGGAASKPRKAAAPSVAALPSMQPVKSGGWKRTWVALGLGIVFLAAGSAVIGWLLVVLAAGFALIALGRRESASVDRATSARLADVASGDDDDLDDIIADDPRWEEGETGRLATFTYVDTDGVVTDRRLRSWVSDGVYIKGWCMDRRANRTFRKDRIEDFRHGE